VPTPPSVISDSTQYIYMQITSVVPGASVNFTAYPVAVAIAPPGTPPTVFLPATWVTGASIPTVQYLIGPLNGGLLLNPGNYEVYVQITINPEVPVIECGDFRVIAAS